MARLFLLLCAAFLTACGASGGGGTQIGPDGRAIQTVYRISSGDKAEIQFRMVDSVNAVRRNAGAPPVELDAKLNAAAATHARDMSVQNRPWHWGSDGSSPIDRLLRVGYPGGFVGENISETYETEAETLAAWMREPATRRTILDQTARKLGFSWHQERNGKIWWVLVTGT